MLIFHIDDEQPILKLSQQNFKKFISELKSRKKSGRGAISKPKKSTNGNNGLWATVGLRRDIVAEDIKYENAENAKEFWERMAELRENKEPLPDVIFLDLKLDNELGEQSGLNLLKDLRKDQDLKLVPVVMVSQHRDDDYITISLQYGANAYMAKDGLHFPDRFMELLVHWVGTTETPSV